MKIISTSRKGRNGYLVFSTCHHVLFQVNVESRAAAELHTVADSLAYIRATGTKACVGRKGENPVYAKGLSI